MQQTVAQLPWGHVSRILDRVSSPKARQFYVEQALQQGWSREVLVLHIGRGLHERQGKAVNNFARTLPPTPISSDLVAQTLKDPYVFDFLNLTENAHERDIEEAMVRRVREAHMGIGWLGSVQVCPLQRDGHTRVPRYE